MGCGGLDLETIGLKVGGGSSRRLPPHPIEPLDMEAVCGRPQVLSALPTVGQPRPQTLLHVLAGCPVALEQGRLTYRHNQGLRALLQGIAAWGGAMKVWCDLPECTEVAPRYVARHVEQYRPDVVLEAATFVCILELTCPWESNMAAWHETKTSKYATLRAAYEGLAGKTCLLVCVEVGARGKLAPSCGQLTNLLGRRIASQTRRDMVAAAVQASRTIFHSRNEFAWNPGGVPVEDDGRLGAGVGL